MSEDVKILFKNEGQQGASAQVIVNGSKKASIHWEGEATEPSFEGDSFYIENKLFQASFFDYLVHSKGLQLAAAEDYMPVWEENPEEAVTDFENDPVDIEKTYEDKMKSLRKDAEKSQKTLSKLALILSFGLKEKSNQTSSWCSACVNKSEQTELDTPLTWGDAYICANCNVLTTKCAVPTCPNFAVRGSGRSGQRNRALPQCAEHTHDIPDFERVTDRIDDLSHWSTIFEYKRTDIAKAVRTGLSIATVASLATPLAFAAAPGIGGAIGVARGLHGVVAANHGLALLGGGSLAAGGLGMAGGQLVVTAIGAGLGGASGMRVATAYLGKDKSFDIQSIRGGEGPAVIFASGFTTEEDQSWVRWRKVIDTLYPNNPVYRVRWGSKELKDLAGLVGAGGVAGAGALGIRRLAGRALRAAPQQFNGLGALGGALNAVANPWHTAVNRSKQAGLALASILMRTNNEDGFILVGHSLGAAMMANASTALALDHKNSPIVDIHLMGAAFPARIDADKLSAAVQGKIHNYFSCNDQVLKNLYTSASFGKKAAGLKGFSNTNEKIVNVDVTDKVAGHRKYIDNVKLQKD